MSISKLNIAMTAVVLLSLSSCGKDDNPAVSPTVGGGGGAGTSFKKIYLATAAVGPGDGGLEQFDDQCDPGYEALVGHTASRRPDVGAGAVNWVLAANTEYRRADGVTIIGKTNSSAVFTFPLTHSFGSTAGKIYTGLQSNWSVDLSKNCNDWGDMMPDRSYGDIQSVTTTAIEEGVQNCNNTLASSFVACVEQ